MPENKILLSFLYAERHYQVECHDADYDAGVNDTIGDVNPVSISTVINTGMCKIYSYFTNKALFISCAVWKLVACHLL